MSGIVLRPWASHEHLKTINEMVLYLEACLEDGDPVLITHALGVIAKACDAAQPMHDVGRPGSHRH